MKRISNTRACLRAWRVTCEGLQRALRSFPNVHQTENCEKCGCPVIVRYVGTGDKQLKWLKCADPDCDFVKSIKEEKVEP